MKGGYFYGLVDFNKVEGEFESKMLGPSNEKEQATIRIALMGVISRAKNYPTRNGSAIA